MHRFVDFTLNGVTTGMIYAAVAIGLVLIWRGTRILNFAQGGLATVTTYVAITVIDRHVSYWLAFVAALATGLLLGVVVERVLIRPVESKPPINAVILTLGLLILLESGAAMIWGGSFRAFPTPFSINGLHVG
ncbi:MAG: ABC transporter permease subunit, partial [Acidimicrobiales bacterium]